MYHVYRNINVIRRELRGVLTSESSSNVDHLVKHLEMLRDGVDRVIGECMFENAQPYMQVVKEHIDRLIMYLKSGADPVRIQDEYEGLERSLNRLIEVATLSWCMNAPTYEKAEVANRVTNMIKSDISSDIDRMSRYLRYMYTGARPMIYLEVE